MGSGGKGGGGSSISATEIPREAFNVQNDQWGRVQSLLDPYVGVGNMALRDLDRYSTPEGYGALQQEYLNSEGYKSLEDQARYNALTAGAATGTLGSSALSNQLAFIAPQLSERFAEGQLGRTGDLVGLGMQGTAGLLGGGQNYANNISALHTQQAGLNQQAALGNAERSSNKKGGILNGALGGAASMASTGNPWAMAAGGVAGGLMGGMR